VKNRFQSLPFKCSLQRYTMGQGQEIIARKYMTQASTEGQWVLLQNTHLGLSYLTEIESWFAKAEELHEDFRLWITVGLCTLNQVDP
jgi:dynein heavy chain